MDDGAMLLAAILAEPDEDIHRLAYADWLDENGRPERAEFIRAQVACSRYTDCPVRLSDLKRGRPVPLRCGACDYCTSRRQSEELSHRFPILPPSIPAYGFCLDPGAVDGNIPHGAGLTVTVRRGFVEHVTCPATEWIRHADDILREHPVTRVTLTTWPDEDWHSSDMLTTNRYRLTARNEGQSRVFRPARPDQPRLTQPCTRERIAALLADEWPRIAFTLPASAPGHRTVFSPA
jgi:uncharacterized protein (TIGR02996 family)